MKTTIGIIASIATGAILALLALKAKNTMTTDIRVKEPEKIGYIVEIKSTDTDMMFLTYNKNCFFNYRGSGMVVHPDGTTYHIFSGVVSITPLKSQTK